MKVATEKESTVFLTSESRVAIINRGEAAVRFIKAVKEFNRIYNYRLTTIAIYTEEEKEALFVKMADEATKCKKIGHSGSPNPYIDRELMLNICKSMNCDAVWVGWGFLSEDVLFAQMIENAKIVFIGPSSTSMSLLGDKIAAKKIALQADVPLLPWSGENIPDVYTAQKYANKIGYPIILKAANAGGGRGIRKVLNESMLESQFNSAREETIRITGNDTIFLEAMVEEARHLEVQIIADMHGNIQSYGVRDCSLQRNNQKVIEETGPANLDQNTIQKMESASRRLIAAAKYYGVGTVEFIYDLKRKQPFFMEVNTRLQVEHPITEQLYGIDLVKMQLLVAMGKEINFPTPVARGVALEARLNAEDPDKNFTPAPGEVSVFRPPVGPGIRVDAGIEQGDKIPPTFDSMIAKIIAVGNDRQEAISRLIGALDELKIKIEGGTTNRAFLQAMLAHPEFRKGGVSTAFITNLLAENKEILRRDNWPIALFSLAIYNYEENYLQERANFLSKFDRPALPQNLQGSNQQNGKNSQGQGFTTTLSLNGERYVFQVRKCSPVHYHLNIENGNPIEVEYVKRGPRGEEIFLTVKKNTYRVQQVLRGDSFLCEVDGIPYSMERDLGGVVKAPFPSMVLSVVKEAGQEVKKGEVLVILEAMKMEMPIVANHDGIIESILVKKGEQMSAGQTLAVLNVRATSAAGAESDSNASSSDSSAGTVSNHQRISFNKYYSTAAELFSKEYLAMFLGFDGSPEYWSNQSAKADKEIEINTRYQILKKAISLFIAIERPFSKKEYFENGSARGHLYQDYLKHYFRRQDIKETALPSDFLRALKTAINCYNNISSEEEFAGNKVEVDTQYENDSRSSSSTVTDMPRLTTDILYRLFISHAYLKTKSEILLRAILNLQGQLNKLITSINEEEKETLGALLDQLSELARESDVRLADAAAHTRYQLLDNEFQKAEQALRLEKLQQLLNDLFSSPISNVPVTTNSYNHGNTALSIDTSEEELLTSKRQLVEEILAGDQRVVVELLQKIAIPAAIVSNESNYQRVAFKLMGRYYYRDIWSKSESAKGENECQEEIIQLNTLKNEEKILCYHLSEYDQTKQEEKHYYLLLIDNITNCASTNTDTAKIIKNFSNYIHGENNKANKEATLPLKTYIHEEILIFTINNINQVNDNINQENGNSNFEEWKESLNKLAPHFWPNITTTTVWNIHAIGPNSSPDINNFQFRSLRKENINGTDKEKNKNRFEEDMSRGQLSPLQYRELRLNLFANFELTLLEKNDNLILFSAKAYQNPKDERLIALVEIPEAQIDFVPGTKKQVQRILVFEEYLMAAAAAIRLEQAKRKKRAHWNRIIIHIRPPLACHFERLAPYPSNVTDAVKDLHLEKAILYYRLRHSNGRIDIRETRFENTSNPPIVIKSGPATAELVSPLNDYENKVIRSLQLGSYYPYALVTTLMNVERHPKNNFEEFEIVNNEEIIYAESSDSELASLVSGENEIKWKCISVGKREFGHNKCNVVFGIITNYLKSFPEGFSRVLVLSDPTTNLGALGEEECKSIISAIDLAEKKAMPVEWIPISSGARIDMESGTENLDWTARVLKRIIEFTQKGGEINIIVAGINVGAQSYWNAEATMLMHTRGTLIMTEQAGAAMLLTGKKALDFSGGVSGENNYAIGGVEKIMGPNGQAQFQVKDINQAFNLLFKHYEFTYVYPGEKNPRRRFTEDPWDRDVTIYPYEDQTGTTSDQQIQIVGDILSAELNPQRKRPFDIRAIMKSIIDQDNEYLERWHRMENAETAVVWEAQIGGYSVGLLAIESRPLKRLGYIPNDGPESWSGGTLFPLSSKKMAHALNAFSDRLPVVVLANLSGFDGSPESLRQVQLEFGAEIGRAVVNFKGPIIFVVIARYHGGAYVVFSQALNPKLKVVALENTYASVIGGSAAAAVIFPALVAERTLSDERIIKARKAKKGQKAENNFEELYSEIYNQYQMQVAREFDQIHSVERAQKVGSVHDIISANQLRPYLINAIEEGLK